MTLINEIKISDESYKFKENEEKNSIIKNLSKVNIFVGANNEGKSRFLRSLFSDDNLEFTPNDNTVYKLNNAIKSVQEGYDNYIADNFTNAPDSDIDSLFQTLTVYDFLKTGKDDYLSTIFEIKEKSGVLPFNKGLATKHGLSKNLSEIGKDLIHIIDESFLEHYKPLEELKFHYNFKRCYIPILRGLRPIDYQEKNSLQINPKDEYQIRTNEDYFKKPSKTGNGYMDLDKNIFTISTGLQSYKNLKKYMLTIEGKKRDLIKEFEKYLSENFFENMTVEIIPVEDEKYKFRDAISVKIGYEDDKLIHNVGDGIQSIIIMSLPLFLYKGSIEEDDVVLVFIEEPEHLLHPGLQRKLLDLFFDERFNNFQFFFTTHSNHFLDITIDYKDISIYSFKKKLNQGNPEFLIENLSKGDANALELLGVRNSSVFLSNCTIWVEGITDVGYLRHYLDIYLRKNPDNLESLLKIEEDYHYSFVEYGGNNITHWSFLDIEDTPLNVETLCGRLFLIVDKDEGKEERHEKLKTFLDDRLHVLNAREIENLVAPHVLLNIIADYEKGDDNLNQKIKYNSYKDIPLGEFIDDKIIVNKENKKIKTYATASGTIRYKNTFLKKAKTYIQSWDDLTKDAQNLTRQIYNFIAELNG